MVRIAIACTSLLGVVLAQNQVYCQTGCQTETPTIWYNCPTPTVPLSVAPSASPQTVPTAAPTSFPTETSTPSKSPATSAPSKAATISPTSPTKSPATSSPSTSPATSAPSTSPATSAPSVSPSAAATPRPSVSPSVTDEDLAPGEAEPTGSPSASPSASPATSAPTKGPTSPSASPSASPATSAPSASPTMAVTNPPTTFPTTSPCLCATTKAAPFKMPLPTYTCPNPPVGGSGSANQIQGAALDVNNPDVIKYTTVKVTVVTNTEVENLFPAGTTPSFTPTDTSLPAVQMAIVKAPVIQGKVKGKRVVTIKANIDLTQLIGDVQKVKASYQLLLADILKVNLNQITGLVFRRGNQVWARKASTLANSDVEVEFNLCDTKGCSGSTVAAVVPDSVKNLPVYKAAIARTPRTGVTFTDVLAALQPGNNINSVISGMTVYVKVRAAPVEKTATVSGATAFKLPVYAYWDDIAANPGTSKAAWIYALADFFSPKLNPNQIKNVVMTSAAGATYGRRAGVLAQSDGDNSQEIDDSTTNGFSTSGDDDDSSIIAVAVVVPITAIAIILVIVWYCCCGGAEEESQAKDAQNAPYGAEEQPREADQVDGEVPGDSEQV